MKTPSIKALVSTFSIDAATAGMIKRIGRAVDDNAELEAILISIPAKGEHVGGGIRYSNRAWCVAYALRAINALLDMHGVEYIPLETERDSYTGSPAFEYLNAGDTYAATLIYDKYADRLYIGSWGDLVESLESRGRAVI